MRGEGVPNIFYASVPSKLPPIGWEGREKEKGKLSDFQRDRHAGRCNELCRLHHLLKVGYNKYNNSKECRQAATSKYRSVLRETVYLKTIDMAGERDGMWGKDRYNVYTSRICVEKKWKTTLNTPDLDSNLDLPILGSLVYCGSRDHATNENEQKRGGHHYIASPLLRMTITSRFGNQYIAAPSPRISPTSLHTANPTLTYNQ
ncbi:unnamed protein product [Timema podura]|uniref:Uncharacterized protein n=1 Tax=Timema podura TaxID=61482 RepID=A0ABN7NKE1_TIMPD|nr:unnamed protein product [Timema podura]